MNSYTAQYRNSSTLIYAPDVLTAQTEAALELRAHKTSDVTVSLFAMNVRPPQRSWMPVVQIDAKWQRNALRFATREQALACARNLQRRWKAVRKYDAHASINPVNYIWKNGLVPLALADPEQAPLEEAAAKPKQPLSSDDVEPLSVSLARGWKD